MYMRSDESPLMAVGLSGGLTVLFDALPRLGKIPDVQLKPHGSKVRSVRRGCGQRSGAGWVGSGACDIIDRVLAEEDSPPPTPPRLNDVPDSLHRMKNLLVQPKS